jgi:hypothetical protein
MKKLIFSLGSFVFCVLAQAHEGDVPNLPVQNRDGTHNVTRPENVKALQDIASYAFKAHGVKKGKITLASCQKFSSTKVKCTLRINKKDKEITGNDALQTYNTLKRLNPNAAVHNPHDNTDLAVAEDISCKKDRCLIRLSPPPIGSKQ